MGDRPMHVYCQQMVGVGRWCQTKAVAPDPRSPLTSSLCRKHLNALTKREAAEVSMARDGDDNGGSAS